MIKSLTTKTKIIIFITFVLLLGIAGGFVYMKIIPFLDETKVVRTVSSRLRAHLRKADILVTKVVFDEEAKKLKTSIRFTEYDSNGKPMEPVIFHLDGDVIQIQSLMIDFDNLNIENAVYFKNKNAYLFWKAFLPDGEETKQIELTKINTVPEAYKTNKLSESAEEKIWKTLWDYALDDENGNNINVRNVKIDAPEKIFIPGIMYSLEIEQDGALDVETSSLVKK